MTTFNELLDEDGIETLSGYANRQRSISLADSRADKVCTSFSEEVNFAYTTLSALEGVSTILQADFSLRIQATESAGVRYTPLNGYMVDKLQKAQFVLLDTLEQKLRKLFDAI